ncbi:alpha/beta hydrolase [Brachybacterium hainanense]|uniref:Alpha/beta hydrolase n=1 Tax=Brachybacterium hainanense TaxID=1541174 RepID=A0ABV6RG53_9MICO
MAFSELSVPWHAPGDYNPRGGILLCHGFTGAPQAMRPWGEHHAAAGWEVSLPLLPGHARTWQEMARTTRHDWYDAVRDAALDLLERHERIAVGGLSMGGTLTLALAQDPRIAPRLQGIVLVNPAVSVPRAAQLSPLLWPLLPSTASIASDIRRPGQVEEAYSRTPTRAVAQLRALTAQVRSRLHEVTAPMLLATSPEDHIVPPRDSDLIAARTRGRVERMSLPDSYHVATLDQDAARIFAASLRFLEETAR